MFSFGEREREIDGERKREIEKGDTDGEQGREG